MAQTSVVGDKSIEKVVDYLSKNPGSGIKEISEGIERSISWVSAALKILIGRGIVFKGAQKKILKSGEISAKTTTGYYLEEV